MLVQSLEQLKKRTLSNRVAVVTGEKNFFEKLPEIIEIIREKQKKTVVVFPDSKYFRKYLELSNEEDYMLFPPLDVLPFEPVTASFSNIRSRMKTLLNFNSSEKPILTTCLTLLQNTIGFDELEKKTRKLCVGDTITTRELTDYLNTTGYKRVFIVKEPGEYSQKGFIVDYFPLYNVKPYRIEFFDDEITEIREFNLETQRMTDKAESCYLTPAREFILDAENSEVFCERVKKLQAKYPNSPFLEDLETHPLEYTALAPIFLKNSVSVIKLLEGYSFIYVDVEDGLTAILQYEKDLMEIFPRTEYREIYYHHLRISESQLLRVGNWVNISDVKPEFDEKELGMYEVINLDTTGIRMKKGTKKASKFLEYETETIIDEESIEIGTYIVHEDYGIGKYKGNEVITNFAGTREYLKLEYDSGVSIFVPVENIDRIHKYIGDENLIKLTNLKSKTWSNTKQKVREDIEQKVEELLKLYAIRSKTKGLIMKGDPELENKFFDSFPHIETPAQDKAIAEVFGDMAEEVPMDRLIFGDAGSGKTEVAMRAAFRAVCSGTQVAMLVPTTVLAKQHFTKFEERMKDFGLKVRLLDRFVTSKQKSEIVKKLKEGKIDIMIGTHSLLSRTIQYHNLGLLIIDEEQKFGVQQKEKIKTYKEKIDVLTLSATPIPRTLYMGLSGIKNMSIIDTLPPGRIPIEVASSPFNEKLVKTAILREVSRGGQVMYVHNRVEDIEEVFEDLRKIVPDIKIGLAHGQMRKKLFESTVNDFYDGQSDLLLSTTIIESGVDIPNANTLIIDDSQRYGLSQLYQLRGRVGRSDRRAYAYFLYPKNHQMKPETKSRLEAITTFHGAGSGIQISMRDMEIRGIGNILGMEQHGEINTIGLHLYRQILDDVMVRHGMKQGKKTDETDKKIPRTNVELKGFYFEVMIPEDYVENNIERMKIYRKIAMVEELRDFDDIEKEIRDRFGPLPKQIKNLLFYAKLKFMASAMGIVAIEKLTTSKQFKMIFNDIKSTDQFDLNRVEHQRSGTRGFTNREEHQCILFMEKDERLYKLVEKNYNNRR